MSDDCSMQRNCNLKSKPVTGLIGSAFVGFPYLKKFNYFIRARIAMHENFSSFSSIAPWVFVALHSWFKLTNMYTAVSYLSAVIC